jgi:hypothetical protein
MSKKELQIMIETAVENAIEKTLLDIFEDPDKGLRLKKKLRFRLARQKQAIQAGHRGKSLDEVAAKLGLE